MAKQTIDELAIILTANSERMARDLAGAKRQIEQFQRSVAAIPVAPPKPPDMRAYRQAAKEAGAFRAQAQAAGESVAGFVAKVAATGGTILAFEAGLNGIAGAFQQMKQSVRMAADLEQTTVSFEVMLGSATRAREMLADIRQYAATTPFNNREITAAARQLLAYGFTANQIMPTIRTLGDVSASVGKPMSEVAYLFGTLRTQGRAYTKDITQFTGAGIDVLPALAAVMNKPQFEIKSLIEEGRVEFRDVEAAFRRMTSEGGRYFQMTARQGQTLAGVLEQTADAFDLLKLEFGKVLVDELGIKQAARDLDAFAARLRANADEIRPWVRMAGDMAKAGAQVGYEFARAGVAVASLNLDALNRTFPGIKAAADSFQQMLRDAQEFKIDEEKLIDFGANLASALVTSLGKVADFAEAAGTRIKERILDPAERIANRLDTLIPHAPAARDLLPLGGIAGLAAREVARPPAPPPNRQAGEPINRFNIPPPEVGMNPDRAKAEWAAFRGTIREMETALAAARPALAALGDQATVREWERQLDLVRRQQQAFRAGFEGDPADVERRLNAGEVPPIRGAAPVGQSWAQQAVAAVATIREEVKRTFRESRDLAVNRAAALAAIAGPAAMFRPPVGPGSPGPMPEESPHRSTLTGAVGPAGMFRLADPRQEIAELGISIRREYDPRPELELYRRQLDELRSRQLMGPNTDALVNRAWRDRLTEVGGRLGIDNRYQLPDATTVGTSEDARIITAWRTQGTNQVTTDGLLQQILQAILAQTAVNANIPRGVAREIPPIPPAMKLPGE
ncbi:hypothetical protein J0H58_26135 [bacterium]|nr:hypothetical protein [bacterium]